LRDFNVAPDETRRLGGAVLSKLHLQNRRRAAIHHVKQWPRRFFRQVNGDKCFRGGTIEERVFKKSGLAHRHLDV